MISCTSIENDIAALQERRQEQAEIVPDLKGAGHDVAQEQLDELDAQIASRQADLKDCRDRQAAQASASGPPSILGTVTQIECLVAKKELGPDEPYLLIATFDLTHTVSVVGLPVPIPAVNVVKIGPWSSVTYGETRPVGELPSTHRPAFWDTEAKARPIAHPTDVIVLVAMMENDGSSPDAIRGAVRTALQAAMADNLNRAYSSLVTTMVSNMQGAIETSVGLGLGASGLNPDDLFEA